jgi:hypothetical protein
LPPRLHSQEEGHWQREMPFSLLLHHLKLLHYLKLLHQTWMQSLPHGQHHHYHYHHHCYVKLLQPEQHVRFRQIHHLLLLLLPFQKKTKVAVEVVQKRMEADRLVWQLLCLLRQRHGQLVKQLVVRHQRQHLQLQLQPGDHQPLGWRHQSCPHRLHRDLLCEVVQHQQKQMKISGQCQAYEAQLHLLHLHRDRALTWEARRTRAQLRHSSHVEHAGWEDVLHAWDSRHQSQLHDHHHHYHYHQVDEHTTLL